MEAEKINLKGALGHLERRSAPGDYNEFGDRPLVSFKAERTVMPPMPNGDFGRRTLLELRIGSSYSTFRSDDDEAIAQAEKIALRALCRCLYQDVLDELLPIMQAVGDGKRRRAMELLNDLYVRLDGRDS